MISFGMNCKYNLLKLVSSYTDTVLSSSDQISQESREMALS